MRLHFYVENNTPAWVDLSDRVVWPIGQITWKATGTNEMVPIEPPRNVTVLNPDGWWGSATQVASGAWEGVWEGRRVKITRDYGGTAEVSLGIFRIADEYGFIANADRTGTLILEPLIAALDRADPSDVSYGTGNFQQIPYTEAIRRYASDQTFALPSDSSIPYEGGERWASSVGRPGSYSSAGWQEVIGKALGCVYNEASGKVCYWTATELWELDPDTMFYAQVTVTPSLVGDIFRVWWRRSGVATGYYLIVTAEDAYDPRAQTSRAPATVHFYNHSSASEFGNIANVAVAPVLYRDTVRNVAYALGIDPNPDDRLIVGCENWDYGDSVPEAGGTTYRRENICIPFDQYAFPLWSRDGGAGGEAELMTTLDYLSIRQGDGSYTSGLNAYTAQAASGAGTPSDKSWRISRLDGVDAGQEFRDNEIRTGRGYYTVVLTSSDGAASGWDTDATSYYPGFRHAVGQGPMLDISYEHTGNLSPYDTDTFWVTYCQWDGDQWLVKVTLFNNTTTYTTTLETMPVHKMPTFVVCDITRPTDTNGRGCVMYGWVDFYDSDDADNSVSAGTGQCFMAESGFTVWPCTAASATAAATFSATYGGTQITFGQKNDLAAPSTEGRWYGDNSLISGQTHISGRWTPISMGFHRNRTQAAGVYTNNYHIPLVCLDRMEMGPTSGGATENDPRGGALPYRILYVSMDIDCTAGAVSGCDCVGITDTYGPGYDIQAKFPMPPMGFNRVCTNDSTNNLVPHLYFVSPGDNGLYRCGDDTDTWDTTYGRPQFVATLPHSANWMGVGTLAVGREAGDWSKPRVWGVSHPAFPLSSSETWPDGEYNGWYYGERHSGRIPLLDNADLASSSDAIGLCTELADVLAWYDRAGAGAVLTYPDTVTIAQALTPDDYASGRRTYLPIYNYATRSVNDVVPGDAKVTLRLGPKSRMSATPIVTGLGVKPVDIALRCIASGMASNTIANDPKLGQVLWGWKKTGKRVKTTLAQAAAAAATTLYPSDLGDMEVGDFVTFNAVDADLAITAVSWSSGYITVAVGVQSAYPAGSSLWVDKKADGRWSHQLMWDGTQYQGIASVATDAASGKRQIDVYGWEAFAPGTLFQISDKSGADTGDYSVTYYRVLRVRTPDETGGKAVVEFIRVDGDEGLTQAVVAGDPITLWVNIPPTSRSVRIGQTGVAFALAGQAGDAGDDTEQAIAEGDMIELSYPGLILKKNQYSKITSSDQTSIAGYGLKKSRSKFNKFMDYQLASMDTARQVRRGAEKRARVELQGVDPARALALEPFDIVTVTDYDLFGDKATSSYAGYFLVMQHSYDPASDTCALVCDELSTSTLVARAPTSFSVLGLQGLALWLDATQETALSDGAAVSTWEDRSGNNYDATQGTAAAKPHYYLNIKNSQPAMYFDGGDFLSIGDIEMCDNSNGVYIAAVGLESTGSAGNNNWISKYSTVAPGYRQWHIRTAAVSVQEASGSYDANTSVSTALGENTWAVLEMYWQPGEKVNGLVSGTLKTPSITAVADTTDTTQTVMVGAERAGATDPLTGYLAEIIVCSHSLTDQDRKSVRDYLGAKWDITIA